MAPLAPSQLHRSIEVNYSIFYSEHKNRDFSSRTGSRICGLLNLRIDLQRASPGETFRWSAEQINMNIHS